MSILNARYEEKQNVIDDMLNILGCGCYQKDPMLVKVQSGEDNDDNYAICPKCNKALGLYVGGTSDYKDMNFCWRPSIHMPKEAARIFLRVTDVRVERLQDITDEDLIREGEVPYIHIDGSFNREATRTSYLGTWNSTIKKSDLAKYGWDANPWVWVIEFERVEAE